MAEKIAHELEEIVEAPGPRCKENPKVPFHRDGVDPALPSSSAIGGPGLLSASAAERGLLWMVGCGEVGVKRGRHRKA
jgi:hypothetical protein